MSEQAQLVLVGSGVRHLVESARNAGIPVIAVDNYGDQETARAAQQLRLVQTPGASSLAKAALSLRIRGGPPSRLMYSGGLDARPDLLGQLSECFDLRGNGAYTAALLSEPRHFFRLLDQLEIPYPEVSFAAPPRPFGWLLKQTASCGGAGVIDADDTRPETPGLGAYWQRRIQGPTISVLFLADGSSARVIGFSRLYAERQGNRPFAYAGAIGIPGPDASHRQALTDYVRRLTAAMGLRGVNGIDLVLGEQGPLLLELNARPTATLEIHEARLPGGSVAAHLAACEGRLPRLEKDVPGRTRGYRVIYAPAQLVTPRLPWPAWARDRPFEGALIAHKDPLCTVHAEGKGPLEVQTRLQGMKQELLRLIHRREVRAA